MSQVLARVRALASRGEIRVSAHAYDELADDGILFAEVLAGLPTAVMVEDYPDFAKGPCVLVLQMDSEDKPIHAVWGIPKQMETPAVLVTVYRPDPSRWSSDFMQRKKP
jgi:hypothetical protein